MFKTCPPVGIPHKASFSSFGGLVRGAMRRRVKKAEKAEKAEKATPTSQSKKEDIASIRGAALNNQLKYAMLYMLYMLVEIGAAIQTNSLQHFDTFEILKKFYIKTAI